MLGITDKAVILLYSLIHTFAAIVLVLMMLNYPTHLHNNMNHKI